MKLTKVYLDSLKGNISVEQFRAIIVETKKDYQITVEYYDHPNGAYLDRAFLYSLTSNENSPTLEVNDFVSACHRFGLDSPFPIVIRREKFAIEE